MDSVYSYFLSVYSKFTEIQEKAIPILEGGSNCLIIAPTGTGKTEAAVLPLLNNVLKNKIDEGISVLYVTPLRALNRDMISRLEGICKHFNISISVRHGDTLQSERARQARKAPVLLITTPETLQSILPTKYLGAALRNVRAVVVDEIHELYHTKRGIQLLLALERLEERAPGFQRIGVSATISNTEIVGQFLCGERRCEIVNVGSKKDMHIMIELPENPKKAITGFKERFGLDDEALARLEAITEHVSKSTSTLVFANTRQIVEALGNRLIYLNTIEPFGGIDVHHGSLARDERIKIENAFKRGTLKSIIATSSLELGIDIGSVDLVIQYGSPRQALRLVQRVGRSGHTTTKRSNGVIIATGVVDAIESFAVYENFRSSMLEDFNIPLGALDVLANQLCGIALDKGVCGIDELKAIIKRAKPYADISSESLHDLLEFMTSQRLIGFDGKTISAGARTRMYYYDHLSVIPNTKRFAVKNMLNNRTISALDDRFVANYLEEGSVFITKGLPWKVVSIDNDRISVEPSTDLEAAVPDWTGEDIPVSYSVAQRFANVLDVDKSAQSVLTKNAAASIQKLRSKIKIGHKLADTVFVESHANYTVVYTWLGTQANEALAKLIGSIITTKLGYSVNIKASPYILVIEVQPVIDIEEILRNIKSDQLEDMLKEILPSTDMFRYKFITVAKLFGVIERDSVVSKNITRKLVKIYDGTPIFNEAVRELIEDHFDIYNLRRFFEGIRSGNIKIEALENDELASLGSAIISEEYYTRELIMPLMPSSEILESFAKFILSKKIKLVCTYCGFVFERSVDQIKDMEKIVCPSCKSPMIAIYTEDRKGVLEKSMAKKQLNVRGKREFSELLKEASLFGAYGGRAAVALSTYGIGPVSAARVLMMLRREDKLFYTDLIDAQRQFIKNKKYWSMS